MDAERRKTLDAFRGVVNMSPTALEQWLATQRSQEVGTKDSEDDESIGHASGRRIVEILRTKQDDLSDEDFAHMAKVVGYVNRHSAQRPDGDVSETRWRYSLMNWGHDPEADRD